MKNPRKITVSIATSADGYIARPDGDVAWLDRPRPKGHYGMPAFFKSIVPVISNGAGRFFLPLSLLRKGRPAQREISLHFPT